MIYSYAKERKKIENSEWVRQSFMITHGVSIDSVPDSDEIKLRTRYFTTARYKFTDTTIGGNIVINPHAQFTTSADIRHKSMYSRSTGMGRVYSEYIDDNKRMITMNFGVPQFNSLSTFFQTFYDSQASSLARTGRSTSLPYMLGRIAGFIVSISSLPLMLFSFGGALFKWATQKPSSKFYYLKPTMAVYWSAVSSMCNDLAVKTGLVSIAMGENYPSGLDNRDVLTDGEMNEVNSLLGEEMLDSFHADTGAANGINIYAVATRAQRQARRAYKSVKEFYKGNSPLGFSASSADNFDAVNKQMEGAINNARAPSVAFENYITSWMGAGGEALSGPQGNATHNQVTDFNADPFSENLLKAKGKETTWTEFLEAELDDGAQYVSFRVENNGAVGESFSSQVGESGLATKMNQMSGEAREIRNNLAQGNVSDGIIGTAIGSVLHGASQVLQGAADSIGFGGLAALGGTAFVDIPMNWQSSTSNMPSMSYTIKLRSPYGNRYSRFVNLHVPLAMLLVGALPLSTGRHSYTSPFICSLFDRGRAQTRLGIIESIQISRGTTNLPFNQIGEPLGIDVTFTVKDLSTVLHMPISQGFGFKELTYMFDDESMYSDYMAVLGALSLHEQIYFGERLKLAITRALKNVDTYVSVPHATNWLGDTWLGRVGSMLYEGAINR